MRIVKCYANSKWNILPTWGKSKFLDNRGMSYKITVLENPLTTWNQSETRSIVNDIVALKTEGYGRAFHDPLLVIPLDVFEFVGNHILLYKDDKLVMGYKNVFLHDCQRMNLDFPLNNPVRFGGSESHQNAYFEFLKENSDKRICYDCHLTVSNQVAQDPEVLYECLSILYALVYNYRHEYSIDYTFMLGTYFAGTHKTFQKMGAKIFSDLGPIHLSSYDKREALIMLCDKNFSSRTLEYVKKYDGLWKARKLINANVSEKRQVA